MQQHINLPPYEVRPFIEPAPAMDSSVKDSLENIQRTPDGRPWFRFVWAGGETDFWAGYTVMRYPITRILVDTWRVLLGQRVHEDGTIETDTVTLPADRSRWTKEQISAYGDKMGGIHKEIHEAGQPFWGVEEWLPPEVACDGWNDMRWYRDSTYPTANKDGYVDLLGPEPKDGCYQLLFYIKDERGEPRPPVERDVERVRKACRERLEDPVYKRYGMRDRVPQSALREAVTRKHDAIDEHYQQEFEEAKARIKDIASHHILGPKIISVPKKEDK